MVGPSTGKSSKIGKGNASANAQSASAANTNQNSQTQASVSIEAIANMDSQSLTNSFSMRFWVILKVTSSNWWNYYIWEHD